MIVHQDLPNSTGISPEGRFVIDKVPSVTARDHFLVRLLRSLETAWGSCQCEPEAIGEIERISIACGRGDLRNAEACESQQLAGVPHALALKELQRRKARLLLEQMRKTGDGSAAVEGQFIQRKKARVSLRAI